MDLLNTCIPANDGEVDAKLNDELRGFCYWNKINHILDYIIKTAPSRSGGDVFTSLLGGAAPGMLCHVWGSPPPSLPQEMWKNRGGPVGN